jgi:hypothetical protein
LTGFDRLPAPSRGRSTRNAARPRWRRPVAGLGLLDDALAIDLRKPQDYFHRVWATAFRAGDLAVARHAETDDWQEPG